MHNLDDYGPHKVIMRNLLGSFLLNFIKTGLWFPRWLSGKELACQCRRQGFDPWIGTTPWRRDCNPLQHLCLKNSIDREAWWTTVHGVAKSWTRLSTHTHTHTHTHTQRHLLRLKMEFFGVFVCLSE